MIGHEIRQSFGFMDTIILLPEIIRLPQHVFEAYKGMKPLLQIKSNNLNVKIN